VIIAIKPEIGFIISNPAVTAYRITKTATRGAKAAGPPGSVSIRDCFGVRLSASPERSFRLRA
jgi:hypothetical protein